MKESYEQVQAEELQDMMITARDVFNGQYDNWRIYPKKEKLKIQEWIKQKKG